MPGIVVANVNKITPYKKPVRLKLNSEVKISLLKSFLNDLELTTAVMEAKVATVRYLPSLASAKKPPRSPRRLRAPRKLVTIVADLAEVRCNSPTRYVTKFIDIPITHILSESSVPA